MILLNPITQHWGAAAFGIERRRERSERWLI